MDDGGDKVTNYIVLKREKGKKSWSSAAPYVGANEQDFTVKKAEAEFWNRLEPGWHQVVLMTPVCTPSP